MWRLILIFFKLALKFYIRGWSSYAEAPKTFKLSFLFWIRLEDALCAFKILQEQLSLNPIGWYKERRILLAVTQFGAFFSRSSDIMEAPSVALCAFKMSRKLLNAHSKYGGSCSVLSYRCQSYTIGLRDINRAAHAIFWMRIEQIRIRFEQL